MYAVKDGFIVHINGDTAQKYIDEGGYEFWDDNEKPITEKKLQDYVQKDIDAHHGTALIQNLKGE